MAVSSYAFDDFGRNVDPFTGKIKDHKHGYTTDGNIIQPFAFTGYQEDEVSGLKFAQARFYDANAGRFQSEDNVKGFIESPFTLNHYGYCWGNPVGLVDIDGNLPTWAKVAITVGVVAATAAVVVATGGLAAGAIAATAASVSAGTVTATAGLATTVAIGATGGALACGAMDAGYQGVQMTWGKQDHFDTAQNMGAMTNGAVFGGLTATGVGFFGTVAAGGISAAGGNMVTQYQKTGTIDSREVATATAGGMLGAGIGYGITKCISYAAGRIGNTGSTKGACPAEGTASYTEGENETKLLWGSWDDYNHVSVEGQTYARIGNRNYSAHAVERMQPSGNRYGSYIYQASPTRTNTYGRSVSPTFVEDVIQNGSRALQENGNISYSSGTVEVITNIRGDVVTIMTK